MREVRIYQAGQYEPGDELLLSPEASQHVGLVLRMRPEEPLTLFCGDNREFSATIAQVKKKEVWVRIASVKTANRESPARIHLAQAISKGDRMEIVMQKAAELGVYAITPIFSEYCSVKLDQDRLQKKCQQWQSIVIAACEQSGRNTVPCVHAPLSFSAYLAQVNSEIKLLLHPYQAKSWRELGLDKQTISLLIGPEGGFSQDEVRQAGQAGFSALSLGPRILRTETAAITAMSLLQALAGDL